jgi:2'-5' RNA ligase
VPRNFNRYFLALLPAESARAALAAVPVPSGARTVAAQDLHLTLAFLGTLCERSEADVGDAMDGLESPGPVRLDHLQYWAGPRVLCAVASDTIALERLAASLRLRLQSADFVADAKAFHAHVTLARSVDLPDGPAVPLAEPICWWPRELHLMASRAAAVGTPAGSPRYVSRLRYGFGR